jgi:isochorismate pyruvate lyase
MAEAPSMSLDEIRAQIDELDRQIIELIARRHDCMKKAARFKKTEAEVAAPARVEQVIERVRRRADEVGVPPDLVEAVYRTLIAQFIALERAEWTRES